jgi:hypothetical protein
MGLPSPPTRLAAQTSISLQQGAAIDRPALFFAAISKSGGLKHS